MTLTDVRPLRHSDFRRLWLSGTITGLTGQLAATALLVQVQQAAGNLLLTGLVGATTAAATVVGNLLGGTLADRLERRAVLVATTGVAALAAAGLAAVSARTPDILGPVFALVAVQTLAGATGAPARRTFLRALLPPALVPAGVGLLHLSFQLALLLGPAVGALALTRTGPASAYALDALAAGSALVLLRRLPRVRGTAGRAGVLAGFGAVARHPALRTVLLCDLAATLLAMPVAVFPALALARFGTADATGWFLSALAVGGTLAGLLGGRVTSARHPLGLVVAGGCVWGLALAGLGIVTSGWGSLLLLALAGAADTVAVVARGTLVQQHAPEEFLGRVSALEGVVGVAGPGLGTLRGGAVAQATSPGTALVTGGLAAALAVVALAGSLTRRAPGSRAP